jgi:hypothetical protein
MISRTVTGLAFAAGCALAFVASSPANAQSYPPAQMQAAPPAGPPPVVEHQTITNQPRVSRGDFGDWSARRNNIESAQYERLLQTNPAFRQARMRKECGPITDPQLHQSCMASFGGGFAAGEPPMTGSSMPPPQQDRQLGY